MTSSALWHIQLFGVLQLQSSEQTLTRFRTQMTGSLLAYLAYYKGRPQPREVLIDQFWPDVDPKLGRGRLSVALSSLRSQLTIPGSGAEVLLADSFTVALNPVLFETDVAAFQSALKRARRATAVFERRSLLEEALSYYTGDFLVGRYESWVLPEQDRLREQFQQTTDELFLLQEISSTVAVSVRSTQTAPPLAPTVIASGTYTYLLMTGNTESLAALSESVFLRSGSLFFTTVDTACFVFGDVHIALSAAVTSMRAARSELRIALDTGFIDTDDRANTNPALQAITKLLQISNRGQILCSDATATLAWRRPASVAAYNDYRLRDLGRFRLTDAVSPERLFQVEAGDEPPSLFPPLQTTPGDAALLPLTYTRFFGRTNELTRLMEMLAPSSASPLVTLTGIGGIGKTRLAHEVATQLQNAFSGRVWFVALAELQDAERIPDAIREALRLPKDPVLDPLEQCSSFLLAAPSLLVLDNMEQFAAEGRAAALLQMLRERVPGLVCLVTSRQMLGINGERAYPIGPLIRPGDVPYLSPRSDTGVEVEACIMLFEDRARAVRPDFRITDASYPLLLRLCTVLDGIPLAIELAAARIGLLSPAQILTQMEARFALLRSRKRDVPERHRSLWAAIDSSYQLLPQELKRVFARLSVFRGGWTLASMQAVCLDTTDTDIEEATFVALEAIAELQESSLIFASGNERGTPRFQMLDTLREYAAEQLHKQGDEKETRERHAAFFARLAADAEPHLKAGAAAQQEWLDLLERDHDNIRLAMDTDLHPSPVQVLRTANALHRFWLIRGHVTEGRQRLTASLAALPATETVPESDLATAQNVLGVLACAVGALTQARDHFDRALKLYRANDELESIARALNNIGIVATQTGNFADARDSYEQSLSIYRTLGDSLRQSMVLTNLGGVLVYLEDYDAARRVLDECLPIQKAAHDDFTLLRTLQNLAEVALRQGDVEAAAEALYESLALRRVLGDQSAFGDTLATASVILGKWNRMEEASVVWAAAQSLRTLADAVPSPTSAKDENIWIEHIRQTLPEAVFTETHRRGSTMNFDQAIFYIEVLLGEAASAP